MKNIIFLLIILIVSCTQKNSANATDFCQYAEAKWGLRDLGSGQGVTACEVTDVKSKKMDVLGQKVIGYEVKLNLKIEQLADDCESKLGRECNVLFKEKSCIKENGKKVNWCKYPDARVLVAKGKFIKSMNRVISLLQEDGGKARIQVVANEEQK